MMQTKRWVKRTYGRPIHNDEFDYLFKSKRKKAKEKLDIKQKQANLSLTQKQNQIAKAKAEAEVFKAKAEQMRAIAAEKEAAKAQVQLSGANALKNLNYVAYAIGALIVVAGGVAIVYMVKQGKKSGLIAAKLAKAKAAK